MKQLCWLTKLDRSGYLPITVCELLYGSEPFQALLTAEMACRYPDEDGLVEISFETNLQGHIIILELRAIPKVINHDLYACAIRTLGKRGLPLLTRFVGLLGLITDPHLRRFVNYWSTHPEQFQAFLMMPASYQDHHAYQHGLLLHSLEVAELAYSNALRLHHPNRECQGHVRQGGVNSVAALRLGNAPVMRSVAALLSPHQRPGLSPPCSVEAGNGSAKAIPRSAPPAPRPVAA